MQFNLTENPQPFSLSGFVSTFDEQSTITSSMPVAPPGFHQEHMPIPPSFDYSSNLTSGFSSLGLSSTPSDSMRIAISPTKPAFERRISGSSPHQSSSGLGLFRASSPQNAPESSPFQMNLESSAFGGFSMMSSPTLSSYTSPQSNFSQPPLAQPTFQRALSAPTTSSTSPPSSQSSSSYASIISKQPPRPPPVALPKCRKFSKAKQEAFKQALNTETGVPGVYLSYFRRYCDDQLRLVPRAQLCLNKCISGCNKSHTVLDVMRYNPLYKLFVCCDESHYDGKERANCAGVHFDFDELKWDLNRLKELIREKSNLCNRKLTCTDDNCIKSHSVEEICWYRPNFRTEQCNTPKAHNTAICWYYHTESDKRYLGDMVGRAIEVPFITRSAHRKMAYELEKLAKMNCLCTD
ncbi:hypothetical protein THRCLA_09596 [Thraustotheca clavata]|uniref:Uncharacterized protein n=1 Tax=Thraustotheca clavata TaxID=74557 RepID=A0A1V9YVA0_9STRA|nr:hypothetical protein THRCLA_09596 [Thraustotheca clavata]